MKNYYYCKANFMIYTENEMINSSYPKARFKLVGQFKNREQAEHACDDAMHRNGKRI